MKYLYVCTSSTNDFFLEQTFVSIVTLKTNTPHAFVSLLIDENTKKSFVGGREEIEQLVDELIVVDLDGTLSGAIRSRLLKTSMRNHVDGDFLFIDSDTIVFDNLADIFTLPHDFAGVLDCHALLSCNPQIQLQMHKKQMRRLYADENFLNSETYVNSGVLFVRDTLENRSFFKQWNALYIECLKKYNILQDQPTLALCNFKHGFPIKILEGVWNCQLNYGAHLFRSAKILHFFASVNIPQSIQLMYNQVRQFKFDDNAVLFIKRNFEKATFDLGHTAIVKGCEYSILNTALYRLLIYLFSSHKKIFCFFEKIVSVGRGHGLYYKTKKGK